MSRHRLSRGGFTLVEALAALLLITIVLPVVMLGIDLAASAGSGARRRDEAAGLGQAKLAEIVTTGQWQSGNLSGDFSPDWPDYRWEAAVQPQIDSTVGSTSEATLQQLDLRVTWQWRGRPDSITLSTLVYQRTTQ